MIFDCFFFFNFEGEIDICRKWIQCLISLQQEKFSQNCSQQHVMSSKLKTNKQIKAQIQEKVEAKCYNDFSFYRVQNPITKLSITC